MSTIDDWLRRAARRGVSSYPPAAEQPEPEPAPKRARPERLDVSELQSAAGRRRRQLTPDEWLRRQAGY